MAITIKGIRLDSVSFHRVEEEPGIKLQGNYSLLSSEDKVLAKQDFNGYNSLILIPSPATQQAIAAACKAIKTDLEMLLGI